MSRDKKKTLESALSELEAKRSKRLSYDTMLLTVDIKGRIHYEVFLSEYFMKY